MSLPLLNSSCMAHIFSFSNYSTLSNCRLACSQFNNIIKNYKIQKLRVQSIDIDWIQKKQSISVDIIPYKTDYEALVFGLSPKKRKIRYKISENRKIQDILKDVLIKINHSEHVYFSNLHINDDFLLISQKYGDCFRKCKLFTVHCCMFSISLPNMKHLVQVIQSEKFVFVGCSFPNQQIVSAECFSGTPIAVEQSRRGPLTRIPLPYMDDKYLESFGDGIFDTLIEFEFCVTGFTFQTISKLVKERLNRQKPESIWNFGIIRRDNWSVNDFDNFMDFFMENNYKGYYGERLTDAESETIMIHIPSKFSGKRPKVRISWLKNFDDDV